MPPSLPLCRHLQFSLSAVSLTSAITRRCAVFFVSALRGSGILGFEIYYLFALKCSSAFRRLALPGRSREHIGAASSLQATISPGGTCFPEYR